MDRDARGSDESLSGPGSTMEDTLGFRAQLPNFIKEQNIRSVLDAPCGDWRWMNSVELGVERYIGADIVAPLVESLQREHGGPGREFRRLDVICHPLPDVDAILCRDLLIHLPNALGVEALRNFQRSKARWLFTTTYTEIDENVECHLGGFRPVNLTLQPFSLLAPIALIREGLGGQEPHLGRSLGIWELPARPVRS